MKIKKQLRFNTKSRIMNAAERLFAIKGIQGTSIKRLACDARVNQAAVNYYFGSMAALIEKVADRRLRPINQQRMQRLETVRQAATRKGGRPLAEDVLRAFTEPALTINTSIQEKISPCASELCLFRTGWHYQKHFLPALQTTLYAVVSGHERSPSRLARGCADPATSFRYRRHDSLLSKVEYMLWVCQSGNKTF